MESYKQQLEEKKKAMDIYEQKLVLDFQDRWCEKVPRASLEEVEYCSVDLGTGGFGAVNMVRYAGKIHAMKAISKANMNSARKAMVQRETRLLHALKHPFSIHLTFRTETPEYAYIGMEPAVSDLGGLLEKKGILDEADCRVYGAQITMALGYLHLMGWIHRDLKPGNVLLMADGYVKLTDFGLACCVAGPEASGGRCGTRGYMAPEVASGGPHTTALDVWSLGVTLFKLLMGMFPYKRQPTLEEPQNIIYAKRFSAPLVCLMKRIFQEDGEKRITCKAMLKDKWFDSIDMDKLYYKELEPPYLL